MQKFERVIRFIMSGSVGAAANLGVLYILVEFFHMHPVLGSVLSFTFAVGVSFLLQKFWTFNNKDLAATHVQASRFLGVSLFNLVVNAGLMYVCIEGFKLYYLFAQFITAGLIAVESFFVYKHLVFLNSPSNTQETPHLLG